MLLRHVESDSTAIRKKYKTDYDPDRVNFEIRINRIDALHDERTIERLEDQYDLGYLQAEIEPGDLEPTEDQKKPSITGEIHWQQSPRGMYHSAKSHIEDHSARSQKEQANAAAAAAGSLEMAAEHLEQFQEEYVALAAIDAYKDGVRLNIDHPLHK